MRRQPTSAHSIVNAQGHSLPMIEVRIVFFNRQHTRRSRATTIMIAVGRNVEFPDHVLKRWFKPLHGLREAVDRIIRFPSGRLGKRSPRPGNARGTAVVRLHLRLRHIGPGAYKPVVRIPHAFLRAFRCGFDLSDDLFAAILESFGPAWGFAGLPMVFAIRLDRLGV